MSRRLRLCCRTASRNRNELICTQERYIKSQECDISTECIKVTQTLRGCTAFSAQSEIHTTTGERVRRGTAFNRAPAFANITVK